MLKAAIFDLNGIFITIPRLSDRFASDFKIPEEVFMPVLKEIMAKVRRPNADKAFSYWQPALAEWGIQFTEEEFWNYWFGAEKESTEMIKLAGHLKEKGLKVLILSNNFKERAGFYGHYPFLNKVVDKIYYSWQTGYVKPDPRAWQHLLEDNDLKPEECVYFDDQDVNLEAARSLGIPAHLFVDVNLTKEILWNT